MPYIYIYIYIYIYVYIYIYIYIFLYMAQVVNAPPPPPHLPDCPLHGGWGRGVYHCSVMLMSVPETPKSISAGRFLCCSLHLSACVCLLLVR